MKIRFQADVDLNRIIVKAVLRANYRIDFQTAQSANLDGLSDLEVLKIAAGEERVLVTHDYKTMPKYFAELIIEQQSKGLVVVPQSLSMRNAVSDLILIWEVTSAEEWLNRIQVLPL